MDKPARPQDEMWLGGSVYAFSRSNGLYWHKVSSFDDKFPSTIDVTSAQTVRSKLTCAHLCATEDRCNSFFYNDVIKKCVTQWLVHFASWDAVDARGWRYFRLNSAACPHAQYYVVDIVTATCYRGVLTYRLNWEKAREACSDRNEMLVVLDPVEKAYFARDSLTSGWPIATASFYIGASRPTGQWNTVYPSTGPNYVWLTGQAVNMTATQPFWQPGKPDNSQKNGNVLRLAGAAQFAWDDTRETDSLGYICEKPFYF
ncbi:uncharacterized protein [Littorina saxatilis]|uniref:uncharacterized protein n=1 Tax=Littorina saxatilis TaxID=31220 RepID=UPI0038B45905